MKMDIFLGKRGSGKTYKALDMLLGWTKDHPGGRYAFVGPAPMISIVAEHANLRDAVQTLNTGISTVELGDGSEIRFLHEADIPMLRGLRFNGIVADATETWADRREGIVALSALLHPEDILIETNCDEPN